MEARARNAVADSMAVNKCNEELLCSERQDNDLPRRDPFGKRGIQVSLEQVLNSSRIVLIGIRVADGYVPLKINVLDAFIKRLVSVLITDYDAQPGMLLYTLSQCIEEGLWRDMRVSVQVISSPYDDGMVEADVLAADCPPLVGACPRSDIGV